ncbi:MAG TPA: transporter substrate-binding domain-containing protein [Devosia sp.]|nr:transporter substrate-binding domain-containing protein [Devosia sp.]
MRLAILPALLLLFFSGAVEAQNLPNFVDPAARDLAPDLKAVPSIRFLTTADFPPFNYRDKSGNLVGFNVDLAKAICSEFKIGCTIQAWPWAQAGKALADNQGDALIAGLALTPENGNDFDFSDIYLGLPGRFVTKAAAAKGFDPARLDGKTIAVRAGTAHAEFVRRYLPKAKLATFDTEMDALGAVSAGKADAYFGDAMRASFWLNDNPGCCAFAGEPYFRPDLFGPGLTIAVAAGHDNVRDVLNAALVKLKRDGTFDDLYLRWFPVGFY